MRLNSTVRLVSDGTVQRVDLTYTVQDGDIVMVYFDDDEVESGWSLQRDTKPQRVDFQEPIPAGTNVLIRRFTDMLDLPHRFHFTGNAKGGAEFNGKNLDENFEKILRAAQDAMDSFELVGVNIQAAVGAKEAAYRAEIAANRAESEADRAKLEADRAESEADRARSEATRAEAEADRAEQAASNMGGVVLDEIASLTPEAGKVPLAGANGKIHSGWIDFENEDLYAIIERIVAERCNCCTDPEDPIGLLDPIGVALVAEKGNGGTLVHINGQLEVVDPPSDFFDNHEIYAGIEHVVVDGQDMIKIPKFYVKTETAQIRGYDDPCPVWLMSATKKDGYKVHPAFMHEGVEIDHFYVGKYQASDGGGVLCSLPDVLPATQRTIHQFISEAEARNTGGVDGFMLWSIWQLSAIQVLYLIENATFNSQEKTGYGRVWGESTTLAKVDDEVVAQATYRGIVGLWGNAPQFIDGLAASGSGEELLEEWEFNLDGTETILVWDQDGHKTLVDTGLLIGENGIFGGFFPDSLFMDNHNGIDMSLLFMGVGEHVYTPDGELNSDATIPDDQIIVPPQLGEEMSYTLVGGSWTIEERAGLWNKSILASPPNYASYGLGSRIAKIPIGE